jgi:signal transduction histidine kinase
MSAARAAGHLARATVGAGRIVLALSLLAALWIGTVTGVDRASHDADDRRAADRSAIAAGFAASVREWLNAGRAEAITFSRSVPSGAGPSAQTAVQAFLAQPRIFARSAVVFSGATVTAASRDHAVLVGLHPKPCTRKDESGAAIPDMRLDELVSAARSATAPVVSQIFDVPGACGPAVGVAVSSGSAVSVVLGDIDEASSRLAAGGLIADALGDGTSAAGGGTRIMLVTGDSALEPQHGVVAVPPRVSAFVAHADGDARRGRYPTGDAGEAEVLAALAPVTPGWSVVLEQDAAIFDIELQNRPSLIVATMLTIVFAIVFALLAFFDVRRKRAHRRTEVTKNAFFSIAGHELRTPLTVIKGFAETLSTNWKKLDDSQRRTVVDRMVPQARRLDRLVERLLVAASIQAETQTKPQVRVLDTAAALETVAERFRLQAPLHSLEVDADADASVEADPRAFDQILEHLVDNAVKYSPSGGCIRIRAVARGRRVDVIVEDDGVGLPSDHRRIFDKFVQGEAVTKRVHDEGGVGLGLYIVRTLVDQMDGSVRAEPHEDGGARFIVTLRRTRTSSFGSRTDDGTSTNGTTRSVPLERRSTSDESMVRTAEGGWDAT